MDFKLSLIEKHNIVIDYGSNLNVLNKAQKVLNNLGIIDDREDFYDLLCLIALEYESMKDMKATDSNLARKSLSEVIASVIYNKYIDLDELSPLKRCKIKTFVNQFIPPEEQ